MAQIQRPRKSPKQVLEDFAMELMQRKGDRDVPVKLLALETYAFRMGWNELYNKLRFRKSNHQPYWIKD